MTKFACVSSLLAAVLFLGTSQAQEILPSPYRDPETVGTGLRPIGFDRVRKASVNVNMNCSGTFISRHGHVLTALHCLNPGLFQRIPSLGTALRLSSSPEEPNFMASEERLFDVATFVAPGQLLKMMSDPDRVGQKLGRVLVAGKGYYASIDHLHAAEADPATYSRIMAEGYGPPEDFAIFKVEAEDTPCVPIASTGPAADDLAWTIGYPGRLEFIGGRPLWTGKGPGAFSIGRITRGFEEIPGATHLMTSVSVTGAKERDAVERMRAAMNRDGSFFSSVDILAGASGSGLFNAQGRLFGVLNAAETFDDMDAMKKSYTPGISTGTRIERILRTAKSQLSAEAFKEAFDCPVEN